MHTYTHTYISYPGISTQLMDRNNDKNLKPERLNFGNSNNESSKNTENTEKNENRYKNSGDYAEGIERMALTFQMLVYIFVIEYT
jgi:hypothetical protein